MCGRLLTLLRGGEGGRLLNSHPSPRLQTPWVLGVYRLQGSELTSGPTPGCGGLLGHWRPLQAWGHWPWSPQAPRPCPHLRGADAPPKARASEWGAGPGAPPRPWIPRKELVAGPPREGCGLPSGSGHSADTGPASQPGFNQEPSPPFPEQPRTAARWVRAASQLVRAAQRSPLPPLGQDRQGCRTPSGGSLWGGRPRPGLWTPPPPSCVPAPLCGVRTGGGGRGEEQGCEGPGAAQYAGQGPVPAPTHTTGRG